MTKDTDIQVKIDWKVGSGEVVVGPTERTVLLVRALCPCSIRYFRLDLCSVPAGFTAYLGVVPLPRADVPKDGRRLVVERCLNSKDKVACYADLPVQLFPGMQLLLQAQVSHPDEHWLGVTRRKQALELKRGEIIGVVVEGSGFGLCRVEVGGF